MSTIPDDPNGYPMGDEDSMAFEERLEERRDPTKAGRRRNDGFVISRKGAIIALASYIAVWVVMAIGAMIYQDRHQVLIDENVEQFEKLDELVKTINDERVVNIEGGCEAQNRRHDQAVVTLDRLIAEIPPENQSRAVETRNFTVALIDALVPKRDCDAVVDRQTGTSQREARKNEG